jgi:hypothetical protein
MGLYSAESRYLNPNFAHGNTRGRRQCLKVTRLNTPSHPLQPACRACGPVCSREPAKTNTGSNKPSDESQVADQGCHVWYAGEER